MTLVAVIGADGMLGSSIANKLAGLFNIIPITIKDVDITKSNQVSEMFSSYKPDIAINCAAYTDVDSCEKNRKLALDVNAGGVLTLAKEAKKNGALVVHFSTDYIFDGAKTVPYTENDVPSPVNYYGQSKLEGDMNLINSGCEYIIIRTEWLYGDGGKNFVFTMLDKQKTDDSIYVVNDQCGSPTWINELADAVSVLIKKGCHGVYNVTSSDFCTWYEFAIKIFSIAGLNAKVIPVKTSESNRPAARPAFSVLDCSKFERETGITMKKWDEALFSFLKEELINI